MTSKKSYKTLRLALILALAAALIFAVLKFASDRHEQPENARLSVVSTVFPAYDFVRAILGDQNDVANSLLLSPGADSHDYEPTPADIQKIENADLFIYVGGESDTWVDQLLSGLNGPKRTLKLLSLVDPLAEEDTSLEDADHKYEHDDNHEHEHNHTNHEHDDEHAYDEHVWTDPKNAVKITEAIANQLAELDHNHAESYLKNAKNYINELERLDLNFQTLIRDAKRHELVFADRFPLLYFVKRYGLSYTTAFPGCSEKTEASAAAIAALEDKIKRDHIPVIFTIELSDQKLAKTLAATTGAKILTFHSLHNITKSDFDRGATYLELMNENLHALEEALN